MGCKVAFPCAGEIMTEHGCGWDGSLVRAEQALLKIRTACPQLLATLTLEIANIQVLVCLCNVAVLALQTV